MTRLPLSLQCHLAQVEYYASHPDNIPIHLAFRDWMAFASSLVYDTWDSTKFERVPISLRTQLPGSDLDGFVLFNVTVAGISVDNTLV